MFLQGPKKQQTFIYNEKKVELPDLVKEIIVFHIRDKIWTNEAEAKAFVEQISTNMFATQKAKERDGWLKSALLIARVRRLDDETIEKICKEFMKLF